jgi:IS1 family transposase
MNKLPLEKRVQILAMLVEGSSMRSVSRVAKVSINTVSKLLVDAGEACANYHYDNVKSVKAQRIQCDEIWAFCYSKQANTPSGKRGLAGDLWTWTAIEADSKLIVSYMIGDRDARTAHMLMTDLQGRLANRVQLTTDGHRPYLNAVTDTFGDAVDYAMLVKLYGETPEAEKRYSPAECIGARKEAITGNPDPRHISTSYTERHNLTMRMSMRRYTRLTNAFSKKIDNHVHMVALYTVWYNFVRGHKALKGGTPAMAAGLIDHSFSMEWLAMMVDESLPKPGPRGPYKRNSN